MKVHSNLEFDIFLILYLGKREIVLIFFRWIFLGFGSIKMSRFLIFPWAIVTKALPLCIPYPFRGTLQGEKKTASLPVFWCVLFISDFQKYLNKPSRLPAGKQNCVSNSNYKVDNFELDYLKEVHLYHKLLFFYFFLSFLVFILF